MLFASFGFFIDLFFPPPHLFSLLPLPSRFCFFAACCVAALVLALIFVAPPVRYTSRIEAISHYMLSSNDLLLVKEDTVDLTSPGLTVAQKRLVLGRMCRTQPHIIKAVNSVAVL